jgi:hypothetical protein
VAYVIRELEVIAGPAERGEGEKGKILLVASLSSLFMTYVIL